MARPKKPKNEGNSLAPKAKGLFDHINQLRQVQDPKYFETLTDADKKSWSNYMVCRFLSMQPELVECVRDVSVYLEQPPERFYQILLLIVPQGRAYFPYIKSKNEKKWSKELMELLRKHYEESERNVEEYLNLLTTEELRRVVSMYGYSEKDVEKLINHEA
jgi:hypothetical protein